MHRTQLQLDEATYESLRQRAFDEQRSVAAVIRDILREALSVSSQPTRKTTLADFSFIASGSSQAADRPVSEHHDEALTDAFSK